MEVAEKAAILSEYDFIAVIDTSGSMGTAWKGSTRWRAMQESVGTFIRDIEKLDSDGIDVVQLGGQIKTWQGVTSAKVDEMFATLDPRGSTPLAEALTAALGLAGKSAKKDFIVVFTDGVPDDPAAAAKVLVNAANQQTKDEDLTVLFVQVGDDADATAYLQGLDNNLKGAKFDIVDAKTVSEVDGYATTADLIVAAIND